jgi:heat shock protein HtpX
MTVTERYSQRRLENLKQSVIMVGSMVGLLAIMGWTIWGLSGLVILVALGAMTAAFSPGVSPRLIMRAYRAQPLSRGSAPGLSMLVEELARRAELLRVPQLYWIPSGVCNAFAVGTRRSSSIAVTDCLLRRLQPRELAGVLAHEIAHIRHNDLSVMGLADLLGRLTRMMSIMGQLLLLLNLPLVLMGRVAVPWLFVLLLILAPTIVALLQLGLSRTREFDADLEAVRLTGDPRGLASALARLDRIQGNWLSRIFLPEGGNPEPSILRTHPTTDERVRRLLELEGRPLPEPYHPPAAPPVYEASHLPAMRIPSPRWRVSGLWY